MNEDSSIALLDFGVMHTRHSIFSCKYSSSCVRPFSLVRSQYVSKKFQYSIIEELYLCARLLPSFSSPFSGSFRRIKFDLDRGFLHSFWIFLASSIFENGPNIAWTDKGEDIDRQEEVEVL